MRQAEVIEDAAEKAARRRSYRARYHRERAARDPIYLLNKNVRHGVAQSLRGEKRGQKWQDLVGYSLDTLRLHLEAQFAEGMTWQNIGAWHVDHIRPLASFEITGPDCAQFKAAWALSNLQPLWAVDNLKKSDRWSPQT